MSIKEKETVVIVEDEVQLAAVISEYLQQAGFDTNLIDSGEDALDEIQIVKNYVWSVMCR